MVHDVGVVESVKPALAGDVAAEDLDRVRVVSRGPARRRSELYFLGLDGDAEGCRWVVKQPNSDSRQQDLAAPVSAEDQFRALCRLATHLEARRSAVSVPRPVAYVPEIAAYVMAYVPGPTVTALIRPEAVLRPGPLLDGVRAAAAVLREVHALEPAVQEVVDLTELGARLTDEGPRMLSAAGLPVRPGWFDSRFPPVTSAYGVKVVLHGDFAPENVVLTESGPCCLEPDLADKGWAEHDVVRFLLMLFDAPLFVTGAGLPQVDRLRRTAARAFLDAYYDGRPRSAALGPLMAAALAARWSTRHTDVVRRAPRLGRSRRWLLRRHFSRVLDEVTSPGWPDRHR